MPRVTGAKPRANFNFGSHTATLFGDVESTGRVQYAWLLVVYDAQKRPVFTVSSEVNSMAPTLGGGSHFLCVFDAVGRGIISGSDDWADEELFTARALGVVYEKLPMLGSGGASPSQSAGASRSQSRESSPAPDPQGGAAS